MAEESVFLQSMRDIVHVQSESIQAGIDVATRKAAGRIKSLEIALTDALRKLESERKWAGELESLLQEAVDNEDLSELEEANRRISCPKCNDRKERYEELCASCDRGNEP